MNKDALSINNTLKQNMLSRQAESHSKKNYTSDGTSQNQTSKRRLSGFDEYPAADGTQGCRLRTGGAAAGQQPFRLPGPGTQGYLPESGIDAGNCHLRYRSNRHRALPGR